MNVIFIIYNRPDVTTRVFEAIAGAQPDSLLVVADGPKNDEDAVRCGAARSVIEGVNWSCNVQTDFSDVNLGCRRRVVSGLTWAFEQVESAIILEDDCLPHPTFFPFCQELLERYADEDLISHISGSNLLRKPTESRQSYHISRCGGIWGWATWRRAWVFYDDEMKDWPRMRDAKEHLDMLPSRRAARFLEKEWNTMCTGHDAWGYRWGYSCVSKGYCAIIPNMNLISNIGFGKDATRTRDTKHRHSSLPVTAMKFPLVHPSSIGKDIAFEKRYYREAIVPRLSFVRVFLKVLPNRYFYGSIIRRVPVIGQLWEKWRRFVKSIAPTQHSKDEIS